MDSTYCKLVETAVRFKIHGVLLQQNQGRLPLVGLVLGEFWKLLLIVLQVRILGEYWNLIS